VPPNPSKPKEGSRETKKVEKHRVCLGFRLNMIGEKSQIFLWGHFWLLLTIFEAISIFETAGLNSKNWLKTKPNHHSNYLRWSKSVKLIDFNAQKRILNPRCDFLKEVCIQRESFLAVFNSKEDHQMSHLGVRGSKKQPK